MISQNQSQGYLRVNSIFGKNRMKTLHFHETMIFTKHFGKSPKLEKLAPLILIKVQSLEQIDGIYKK